MQLPVVRMRLRQGKLLSILALGPLILFPRSGIPATFVVTSAADSGTGTLREAVTSANGQANSGGPDVIQFAISGAGAHTIQLLSPLPTIIDPVIIDGATQPG